jgi:CRISPR-associated protein Csd1
MIIHSLVRRYKNTMKAAVGWQERRVNYALDIAEDGRLLKIVLLEDNDADSNRSFMLPVTPVRSSGIKAAFLCDNGGYFLALDPKRGADKFNNAKDMHIKVLRGVNTPSARAIRAFFENGSPQNTAGEISGKDVCVFQVNGIFAHEDEEIKNAWNVYYAANGEGKAAKIRCLITGETDSNEPTHGKIKLFGGQSSGSSLISANAESFTSYGRTTTHPAADVGKYAAFAYVSALNDLLRDKNHHQFLGGDTVVYWAEGKDDAESAVFSWLSNPKEDDDKILSAVMEKTARGLPPDLAGCEWSKPFYIICLSPNAARISVRFFHVSAFGDIAGNIIRHYENLCICGSLPGKYTNLPYWMLLSETTVKKKSSDAAPLLGGQLLRSIITGVPYPSTLYHAILIRIRTGEKVNRTKAAVVKAVLIRNFNEREVTSVALNAQSENQPYVLGRLFSVLERLQEKAIGASTIRERYFAGACANPGSIFPILLKLSTHHAAKLDTPGFIYFEKLKTELLGRLGDETPFPFAFDLSDQGRFILGYYHQTQDFFTAKTLKEENE